MGNERQAAADPELLDQAAELYRRSRAGDFRGFREVMGGLEASGSEIGTAWRLALAATRWLAEPSVIVAPSAAELKPFLNADPKARDVAALACIPLARATVLELDPAALAGWLSFLRKLQAERVEVVLWTQGYELWLRLFQDDDLESFPDAASAIGMEASQSRLPELVVEATTLRALAAMQVGDFGQAIKLARRASRMARTEAIPQPEYLANLVLARMRRLTGNPHLATRILTAILRVAPPVWGAWLRWELVLAGAFEEAFPGGAPDLGSGGSSAAYRAAVSLAHLQKAAEVGDRERFDAMATTLEEVTGRWPLLGGEVCDVLACVDPGRALLPGSVSEGFVRGTVDEPPPALHGLAARTGGAPPEETASAYALGDLEGTRRRLLRLGRPLVDIKGLHVLRQSRRKQGRVETLVATLLLAPDGLNEAECFETVYGFPFQMEMHKGVFDVLLHRAREYIQGAGEIERSQGKVQLTLACPVMVADPRCAEPVQDRLLRFIAANRGASAKDIAKAMGVSVRTAQSTLQELAAEGACAVQKEGRFVRYVVEDTTFSEPTQH
ncbi:MAG: helix-turn-helix domain-containing protein [Myxococcota bacterium]